MISKHNVFKTESIQSQGNMKQYFLNGNLPTPQGFFQYESAKTN